MPLKLADVVVLVAVCGVPIALILAVHALVWLVGAAH
jgi:hypothetical protein